MTDFAAWLLYIVVAGLGRLPWSWLHALGDGLCWLWERLDAREQRVAGRNLELAYPDMLPAQRRDLQHTVLRTTARQALETLRLWTRPHVENLRLIERVEGRQLLDDAIATGRGVIIAAPHYGNWELLNQWFASLQPIALLYRPPESAVGEAFLRRVRADVGDRVTQIRAEGAGIRQLFKLLKAGGMVGILPDQQPKAGDGEFAPFFGIDAFTMTLVGRVAERSAATVLFAYCEQTSSAPRFTLRFEAAPTGIDSADPLTATTALNAGVERVARRDPAQYQWTYKRFKMRPDGSSEPNPYQDLEDRR